MKKLATLLLLFLPSFCFSQVIWTIEPAHSSVHFEVPHLSVSTVTGYFTSFSGSVATVTENDFNDARVNAIIDVSSITTHNLERDKHLREDDFFNTKEYPNIVFKSTGFTKNEDGTYNIEGLLTIRDVTKPIVLRANFGGIILLNRETKAGFTAKGRINRFDYGLKWDDVLDNGGLIVGENVDITLNMTFLKQ